MNKKAVMIIAIVLLAVVLISGFSITLYFVMNNAVTNIIVSQAEELIDHDTQMINNYINKNFDIMDYWKDCIYLRNPQTLENLLVDLGIYAYGGMSDALYLLDSEGKLYSSYRLVKEREDNRFIDYFEKSDSANRFVYRFDDYSEYQRECMVYGTKWETPLELFGVNFVGMVMLRDIVYIRQSLTVSSFDDRGYTALIDANGDYIVNDPETVGLQQYENFFSKVEKSNIEGNNSTAISSKLINNQDVEFWYTDEIGVKRYVKVSGIQGSNWLFVTEIEKSVFDEQLASTAKLTALIFVEVVILMIAVFFLIYKVRVKTMKQYESIVAGVYNRQYYNDKLANQNAYAVAMFDIDHLKHINDTYGHPTGDQAIKKMVTSIVEYVGKTGLVCRFGGDEFVVVWKDHIEETAFREILQNICKEVSEFKIEEYPSLKFSFSIGGYYAQGTADQLLNEADKYLYKAKEERNTVVIGTKLAAA